MAKHLWENDNAAKTSRGMFWSIIETWGQEEQDLLPSCPCKFYTFFFEELSLYFRQKARAQIDYKAVERSELESIGKHGK